MASKHFLLLRLVFQNARDMMPVVLVVVTFQYLVIRQPFPDVATMLIGTLLVLLGLTLFVQGMSMSLFPLGESLVESLAYRANPWLLSAFAFCIGFGSTVAEPALIAVTQEAAAVAFADGGEEQVKRNASVLRYCCALAVGAAMVAGCLRILKGWPASWLVLGGYTATALVAILTGSPLTAVAFDAGAAATSAINIPLISAVGMGLATMIRGRNPMLDGFGLVAFCSVVPMFTLLLTSLFLTAET